MREFKFRAWIKDKETMLRDIKFCNDELEFLISLQESGDGCIITQYTGLKDKNNKEIYEGDVVKFTIERFSHKDFKIKRGKVVYEDGAFKIYTDNKKHNKKVDLTKHLIEYFGIEVIGNIFENPEYLKVKNVKKKA